MNYLKRLSVVIALTVTACTQTDYEQKSDAAPPADIIFVGDNIVTVDEAITDAEAVAVRGEDIIAVGSKTDVLALRGDATRVVELGDRALVPGFIDAHGHMAFVARLIDFVNLS